jgi:hypothetical protein
LSATRVSRRINAPRAKVHRALLDAPADLNETGWRMSLAKLAALVEAG